MTLTIEHGERTVVEQGIWITTDDDRTFVDNDTLYELCESGCWDGDFEMPFIVNYRESKALLSAELIEITVLGHCYGTDKLRELMGWNG